MIFFIRLIRLISKCRRINKSLPSLLSLFIRWRFETKRLSRIKKIINIHYQCSLPARRQVPPVLKSTFKFRIFTPKVHARILFQWISDLDLLFCFLQIQLQIFRLYGCFSKVSSISLPCNIGSDVFTPVFGPRRGYFLHRYVHFFFKC